MNAGFELKFEDGSMQGLAQLLKQAAKGPVIDKTGLTGAYDFDLKFAPSDGPLADDPHVADLPNLFTAVQEQLGLKLVPHNVTIDTLVIDHVDKIPTEN